MSEVDKVSEFEPAFSLKLAVRDYECDLQGVVNNAVYQHYLEHARHEFLKSIGVDFIAYAAKGINFVVVRAELDYRAALRPGDEFVVRVELERESRLRIAFLQEIRRVSDNALIVKARIVGTAINQRGRPELPEEVERLLARQGGEPRE
jgi:acyl-CoA thioester hydrolase